MKHEILHALGFSVSLYAYFRDANGQPLTPRTKSGKPISSGGNPWSDRVIKKIRRNSWKTRSGYTTKDIHMIVTPRVVVRITNCLIVDVFTVSYHTRRTRKCKETAY